MLKAAILAVQKKSRWARLFKRDMLGSSVQMELSYDASFWTKLAFLSFSPLWGLVK